MLCTKVGIGLGLEDAQRVSAFILSSASRRWPMRHGTVRGSGPLFHSLGVERCQASRRPRRKEKLTFNVGDRMRTIDRIDPWFVRINVVHLREMSPSVGKTSPTRPNAPTINSSDAKHNAKGPTKTDRVRMAVESDGSGD